MFHTASNSTALILAAGLMLPLAMVGQVAGTEEAPVSAVTREAVVEPAKQQAVAPSKLLTWLDSLEKGLAQSLQVRRPLLVRFQGTACPHCRVMAKTLEEPAVQQELRRWTLVTLDIDESPDEARRLGVELIPAFRFLTPVGQVIAAEHGVIPADEFMELLKKHHAAVAPNVPAELTESGEPSAAAMEVLIQEFRNRDASVREASIRRLIPYPHVAAAAVVSAFSDGSLSTRLSAWELLREWKAPTDGLDPWRQETFEATRVQALIDWAGAVDPRDDQSPRDRLTTDELSQARDWLHRILTVDAAEAVALRERLARFGPSLLPEVYAQIATAATDQARERLTAVRYRLAAADALAFQWPGGIDRLAATDAETREKAADELARRATAADEPLLLELFSDSSPLVREITLRAMKKLGGENLDGALLRLLDDPEPNVRAAVLKQLVEAPAASIIPRIAKYALAEMDSDLVVHAIRVLREAQGKSAVGPLTELLKHESWQVRSEAAEALGNVTSSHSHLKDEDKVEIYATMAELLQDPDPFVVSRAIAVLAQADLVTAVKPLVQAAETHPELAAEVVRALSQGHRQQAAAEPHLRRFSRHPDARVRAAAITGLCASHASDSEEELQAALADSATEVRTAAAKGLFGIFETRRHTLTARQAPDEIVEMVAEEAAPESLIGSVLKLFVPNSGSKPVVAKRTNSPEEHAAEPVDGSNAAEEQYLLDIRAGKVWTKRQRELPVFLLPLLHAEAADERLAGALALIALGRDADALPALTALAESNPQLASRLGSALPWMLADDRQRLWERLIAIPTDPSELRGLMSTVARLHTRQTEQNLWNLAGDPRIDAKAADAIHEGLREFYFENFEYNLQQLPARQRKEAIEAAAAQAKSDTAWKRTIALAILVQIDKDAAEELARSIADDSATAAEFRQDAVQILLLAMKRTAAERWAVEKLADANPNLRKMALNYLTLGPQSALGLRDGAFTLYLDGLSFGHSFSSGEPVSLEPPEGVEADQLLPLLHDSDRRTAALAGYLLALLSRSDGIDALIDYWRQQDKSDDEWTRLTYRAIAMLDDPKRVGILREIYERYNHEDRQYHLREFYWTIRNMTGPEILALRKTIRDEVGMDQLR